MVVGRLNKSQDPTTLIGSQTDDGGWSGGPGDFVLRVGADSSVTTGGILGRGDNGSVLTEPPSLGGPGVQGDGGPYLGPGVVGRGSGTVDGLGGGHGVAGWGGSTDGRGWDTAPVEPGAGVAGLGGPPSIPARLPTDSHVTPSPATSSCCRVPRTTALAT
jgi:hypothetical protein